MPVNSEHPAYQRRRQDWLTIRDSVEGETVVKARRQTYLPAPPGIASASNELQENGKRVSNDRYSFYLGFAEFPELVEPTLAGFQGIIHDRLPTVELPPELEYLLDTATPQGDTLQALWEMVTYEVMTTGRVSLLPDIDPTTDQVRLAPYAAENLINWRIRPLSAGGGASMCVLVEYIKLPDPDDEFQDQDVIRYRVLRMEGDVYVVDTYVAEAEQFPTISLSAPGLKTIPSVGPGTSPELVEQSVPQLFGRPLDFIPLVVVNTQDMGFEYSGMPALPLARACMSIYRKSADYHRSLYIKGDPQVVISGATEDQAPTAIGGGTIWTLPSPQARAQYLDIDGDGIPLMRQSISDKLDEFDRHTMQLVDSRGAESGEALRRRQFSKHVTLKSLTTNCGEAMEFTLRMVARMAGADPDAVRFVPDTDFAEPMLGGQETLQYTTARNQGYPMSARTLHELGRRGGLTRMSFEEEMAELESEPTPPTQEQPPPPDVSGEIEGA